MMTKAGKTSIFVWLVILSGCDYNVRFEKDGVSAKHIADSGPNYTYRSLGKDLANDDLAIYEFNHGNFHYVIMKPGWATTTPLLLDKQPIAK